MCDGSFLWRGLLASLLLMGALGVGACGDDGPDSGPDSRPDSQGERAIPTAYDAPPEPCGTEALAPGPVLAMHWRQSPQTFVEAGRSVDQLALDYEVYPAAHVSLVRWGLAIDRLPPPPRSRATECPATFDLNAARTLVEETSTVSGDVGRVVLYAEDEERARRGDVFFTTGERTVTGMLPPVGDATDSTSVVFFEPAWGTARLALKHLDDAALASGTFSLEGLPEGPGLMTLARVPTRAVQRDPERGVVYLPTGFADDWAAFVTHARFAFIGASDEEVDWLPTELRASADDPISQDVLRPGLTLAAGETRLVVGAERSHRSLPMNGEVTPYQGTIGVPCGSEVQATPMAHGETTFHWLDERQPQVTVSPGESVTLTPRCGAGATTTLGVEMRSHNGRDMRLVLSTEVAP